MKYVIYKDKAGDYRWRHVARNGKILADGGQGYKRVRSCLHGINRVANSSTAKIVYA